MIMMMTREQKILSCINPATQIGIEIGALTNPIVTREMGNIRYVDHATTEELRSKYAHDPNVDTTKIVEVDYVWGSQSLPELVGDEAPFDYVIASHVIEHVPDFIGWLKEVRAILKPNGVLSLVIPDKQRCFDYYRNTTKPSEVLEAYLQHSRKPSSRQIFDYLASAVSRNGAIAWGSDYQENELQPIHSIFQAWEITKQAFTTGSYVDAHCWVFTPHSFFELLQALIQLNLFDFKVASFHSTEGCEFFVSLQALARADSSERDELHLQLQSLPTITTNQNLSQDSQNLETDLLRCHHTLAETQSHLNQAQSEIEQLHSEIQQLKEKLQETRSKLQQSRFNRKTMQAELEAMKTSKFWKLQTWWSNFRTR